MSSKEVQTSHTAYKGFDKDFKCLKFQYETGKTFQHEGDVAPCGSGFHACKNPLDVFGYYPPATSRFAEVEQSGTVVEREDKSASSIIKIKAELSLHVFLQTASRYIYENVMAGIKPDNKKSANKEEERSHASNTGNRSAASNTGYQSAASNTGDYSAASNTGYQSAASNTGNRSAASNTGYQSAASNTGDYSAASNTGNQSAASNTGDYSAAEVSGSQSVAAVFGANSKARASKGNWIVLTYRNDEGEIKHMKTAQAGVTRGVKPDVWYTLSKTGKIIKADF